MAKQMDIFQAIEESFKFDITRANIHTYSPTKRFTKVEVIIKSKHLTVEQLESYAKGVWQYRRKFVDPDCDYEKAVAAVDNAMANGTPIKMILTFSNETHDYFSPDYVSHYL